MQKYTFFIVGGLSQTNESSKYAALKQPVGKFCHLVDRSSNYQMMKRAILILVLVLLVSCEHEFLDAEMLGKNADIIGTWIEKGYEEDVALFTRGSEFDKTKYGFTINEDGTFVERKNAEWDMTASVSFENFTGQWEALSDSLLEITVGFWGGTMTYQMRIVFLDQQNLGIRYLYAEDRAPSR
jgi:hypothetical protein